MKIEDQKDQIRNISGTTYRTKSSTFSIWQAVIPKRISHWVPFQYHPNKKRYTARVKRSWKKNILTTVKIIKKKFGSTTVHNPLFSFFQQFNVSKTSATMDIHITKLLLKELPSVQFKLIALKNENSFPSHTIFHFFSMPN